MTNYEGHLLLYHESSSCDQVIYSFEDLIWFFLTLTPTLIRWRDQFYEYFPEIKGRNKKNRDLHTKLQQLSYSLEFLLPHLKYQ